MATSGSYDFNVTGNDILEESLGLVGIYAAGESIDATIAGKCLRTLNLMLKAMQRKLGLWLNRELSLFLQDDQIKYSIGPTGDHCAESAVKTEVATAASSAATSVVIDSSTGFGDNFDRNGIFLSATPSAGGALTLDGTLVSNAVATLSSQRKILIYSAGDESGRTFTVAGENEHGVSVTEDITGGNATTVYSTETYKKITSISVDAACAGNIEIGQVGDHVGIELDDGTVQWTYIVAALSTTLTLLDALTDDVAVDNHVYSYTTKTRRPIEIIEARLVKASGYHTPLSIMGRHDYQTLSDKTAEGTPNQIYYDKQLTNGVMYVWQEPDDVQEYIQMTARIPIQDVDATTDNFEVADELFEMIAWNLAIRLFPKFGKPMDPLVKLTAKEMYDDAMAADSEDVPVQIQIDRRRG
jgi:hypothetical protein